MKRMLALILCLLVLLCACAHREESSVPEEGGTGQQETAPAQEPEDDTEENTEESGETAAMKMYIGDTEVSVQWEDNRSVDALRDMAESSPVVIRMSMYGGFEQVGAIGAQLPRDDVRITTQAGDIVLYSGDQIVVFYGSNTWAYTRLGRITGTDAAGLRELLSNGDVTLTITV